MAGFTSLWVSIHMTFLGMRLLEKTLVIRQMCCAQSRTNQITIVGAGDITGIPIVAPLSVWLVKEHFL